jgi:LytR cell envelope-related transcriptional attenuator
MVLAVSCLVLGFVAGWALRGGEDSPIVIPAAAETTRTVTVEASPVAPPEETADTSVETAPDPTSTAPDTATAVEPPAPAPAPAPAAADIKVSVLNGSGVTGLAGQTATKIEGLGYTGVTPGNAGGTVTGPSIVYYRPDNEPAARKVAADLGYALTQVRALTDAALVSEAPADATVIVVLGPG